MDRLICGDVGYGKTEVALRAAFKAAAEGKQVLMLVPTTILAQQHYGTFAERLADYPFTLEHVSRFRTAAEQKDAVKGFADGRVDILIGTHRVLSRDVRAKDLGLLIVDEEQRFGVKQKELLRQLKLKVDVISMSATPIPRTLQMSLAGLRDISVIETPPEGRRPVRTYVGEYEEELVRRAIEREHERGGQAFFLHNRVESIEETAERLRALCPRGALRGRARPDGRGRARGGDDGLPARRRGRARVHVDHRVGDRHPAGQHADRRARRHASAWRSSTRYAGASAAAASAPTPTCSTTPPPRSTPEAAQRLSALSDYTELGAGFKIAMRDLEIRGAGNLLGRRAVRTRRRARLRALHADARRGRQGARGPGRGGAGARAGAARRERRRLRARRLRPLRAGQDRRPPPRRGCARGGRGGAAARGARGSLRPDARAAREPARAAARAHQVRRRRARRR